MEEVICNRKDCKTSCIHRIPHIPKQEGRYLYQNCKNQRTFCGYDWVSCIPIKGKKEKKKDR